MVKIKICGIRRLEDVEIVNMYKPDYIGFVFANSKRKVSHELASKLTDNLDSNINPVGVFVNEDSNVILDLFDRDIIGTAQLHGNESEDYIINLKEKTNYKLKIIKAIEISDTINLMEYENSIADYLLLDSGKGSGKTFNWNLIREELKKEFFIAGGINASNITEAIAKFNPYAIDLSSGVETNGFKDKNKIENIMEIIN